MNRYAKDRSHGPRVPRVERVELDDGNIRLRVIVLVLFFVIAVVTLTYGITSLVRAEAGWQEISADSAQELNLGTDFTLLYQVGTPAREERLAVTTAYSKACIKAWQLFNCDVQTEGVVGLMDFNVYPNTEFSVESGLYKALETLKQSGSRYPFYAPLFGTMENLCTATDDQTAAECDPDRNPDTAAFFSEVLQFANNPQSIDLQLLGSNRVCLFVSEDYLAYAQAEGITRFIDLFALRNAFAADYIADCMEEAGYTDGILQSNDGFIRVLNGDCITLPLYDFIDGTVYTAGNAEIAGMRSAVVLKTFPVSEGEDSRYYHYEDGTVRMPWLDEKGWFQPAVSACVYLSDSLGCAELALAGLKAFCGTEKDITALADAGIRTIYCSEYCIISDVPGMLLKDVYDRNGIRYRAEEE